MRIAFLFYEGMTALDAIGPHEVLWRLPNVEIVRVAQKTEPIDTYSAGLIMNADYGIADISHADVLVVPGGAAATTLRQYPDVLAWIRDIHRTTKWTTSVCTGSLILGAAGVLKGLHATTHWAAFDRLQEWGAIPTHGRVVEDGKVITAAGVSAGIDMGLTLAARIAGDKVAESLQLAIEYDPKPPFDTGSPSKADPALCKALRARMTATFEPA